MDDNEYMDDEILELDEANAVQSLVDYLEFRPLADTVAAIYSFAFGGSVRIAGKLGDTSEVYRDGERQEE
jgi:hypothetical protein